MSRERAVIAWLSPANVSRYFHKSMLEMVLHDASHNRRIAGVLDRESGATVADTRNWLTARFLDETDADWLLFIDADMIFPRDALDRLLSQANYNTAPVIGGLYFGGNQSGVFPQLYYVRDVPDLGPMTVRPHILPATDGLIEVSATGAGFLLIHRRVLAAIRDRGFSRAYPWWAETEMSGKPVGEDITFCLRAAMCGYKVHVDMGLPLGHHKSTVIGLDAWNAQQAAARIEDREGVLV